MAANCNTSPAITTVHIRVWADTSLLVNGQDIRLPHTITICADKFQKTSMIVAY